MKNLVDPLQNNLATMFKKLLSLFLLSGVLLSCSAQSEQPENSQLQDYIESYGAGRYQGSTLVAKEGKILFSSGFGYANYGWDIRNEASTVFRIGSISKQFTAAVTLQLVAEGKLELDRPVSSYWNQLKSPVLDQVNIHQLLSHTSGLPLDVVPFDATGANKALETMRDFYTSEQLLDIVKRKKLQFAPGEKWRYSNVGYVLLALLIEHIDGRPFAESLHQRIFLPLKMSQTRHAVQRQPTPKLAEGYRLSLYTTPESAAFIEPSFAKGSGSLLSTVEDLFLWERALRDNQVLPERLTKLMRTAVKNQFAYGLRIDEYNRPSGKGVSVGHRGSLPGFHNTIDHFLDDDIVVILLSNQADLQDLLGLRDGIVSLLLGETPKTPTPMIPQQVIDAIKQTSVADATRIYKQQVKETIARNEGELNNLGYLALSKSQKNLAIKYFKLAVALFPQSANTHDSLGEALLQTGDLKAARESYGKALEISPESDYIKSILARIDKMLKETN